MLCSVCGRVISGSGVEHESLVGVTKKYKVGVTKTNFNITPNGFNLNYIHIFILGLLFSVALNVLHASLKYCGCL